jgi:hypothetical protein
VAALLLAPLPALAASCFAAVAGSAPHGHAGLAPAGRRRRGGPRLPRSRQLSHRESGRRQDRHTELVDPDVKFVLRGNGIAHHDFRYGDVRIRNVPTNIRDGAGTEFGGN